MTEPGVEVVGARELARTLKAAGHDLNEMREPNAEVAGIVANAARQGAPVRTGRLAGTVRASATRRAAVIRAGKSAVPYANPIHWGWGRRNIAANPWVSRAAQQTEGPWTDAYRRAVVRILEKVRGA